MYCWAKSRRGGRFCYQRRCVTHKKWIENRFLFYHILEFIFFFYIFNFFLSVFSFIGLPLSSISRHSRAHECCTIGSDQINKKKSSKLAFVFVWLFVHRVEFIAATNRYNRLCVNSIIVCEREEEAKTPNIYISSMCVVCRGICMYSYNVYSGNKHVHCHTHSLN